MDRDDDPKQRLEFLKGSKHGDTNIFTFTQKIFRSRRRNAKPITEEIAARVIQRLFQFRRILIFPSVSLNKIPVEVIEPASDPRRRLCQTEARDFRTIGQARQPVFFLSVRSVMCKKLCRS